MTEQGYPPRQPDRDRYSRPRAQQQVRRGNWDRDAFAPEPGPESEVPPWAMPGGVDPARGPRRATRTVEPPPDFVPERLEPVEDPPPPRRGRGRSRAAATRRRRSRRRLVTWGSAAVVALVIAAVVIILVQPKAVKPLFVDHLQKGEFTQAPDACKVLPASLLGQYLNGKPSKSVQTAGGASKSECSFSVDSKPNFRVLDITVQAYTPNLIAPGNGSATSYAVYTYGQARQLLVKPPRHAPEPPATILPIPGLGSKSLKALQVYRSGSLTDRATVLVQYRNAMITVSLWATASGGFGPVSTSELQADAVGAARDILAKVKSEPTA